MARTVLSLRSPWPALSCLTLFLACGGGGSDAGSGSSDPNQTVATSTAMTTEEASTVTAAVLNTCQVKGSTTDLPQALVPAGDEGVLALNPEFSAACVSVVPQVNGSNVTTTYTFSNCTTTAGGGSVSGTITTTHTVGGGSYSISYSNLRVVRGTETFTINGTQTATLDKAAKTSTLAMPSPGMSIAYSRSGSAYNGTYSLTGSLNGDYATAQAFKLSGSCSLSKPGGAAETVTIDAADPVTWREGSGCCYPLAGTVKLYETVALSGSGQSSSTTRQVAAYAFTSTCGTVSYTAYTYQLTRSGAVNPVVVGPTSLVLPACP